MTKYDAHDLFIADASSTGQYRIQLIFDSTSAANGITAGTYTETVFRSNNTNSDRAVVHVFARRRDAGVRCWIRCWNASNGATIDAFVGIYEYLA